MAVPNIYQPLESVTSPALIKFTPNTEDDLENNYSGEELPGQTSNGRQKQRRQRSQPSSSTRQTTDMTGATSTSRVTTTTTTRKRKMRSSDKHYRALGASSLHSVDGGANGGGSGYFCERGCTGQMSARKCMMICTPITFLVLLLIVLMVIFLGGKSFAQSVINSNGVEVIEMNVLGIPTDPSDTNMIVRLVGRFDNRSPFKTEIQTSSVSVRHKDKEFGTFIWPQATLITGGFTNFNFTGALKVSDVPLFFEWAAGLMTQKTVPVKLLSNTSIKTLGLRFGTLYLDQDIELNGINGFSDPPVDITRMTFQSGTKDKLELSLKAKMTNPSSVVLTQLNRLNFSVIYHGVEIGTTSTLPGAKISLNRGVNEYDFTFVLLESTGRQHSSKQGVDDQSILPDPSIKAEQDTAIASFLGEAASGYTVDLSLKGHDNSTDSPLLIGQLRSLVAKVKVTAVDIAEITSKPNAALPPDPVRAMLPTGALFYYVQNHNISQLHNYLLQVGFQVSTLSKLTTQLSPQCHSGAGGVYVDVIVLTWNVFNTPLALSSLRLNVSFPGDTSKESPFEPFVLANTHPGYLQSGGGDGIEGALTLPVVQAQSKNFAVVRLCLAAPIPTLINWYGTWVCPKFGATAPDSGATAPDSGAAGNGTSAASVMGQSLFFGNEFDVTGFIDVTVGDYFIKDVPFTQKMWVISSLDGVPCAALRDRASSLQQQVGL